MPFIHYPNTLRVVHGALAVAALSFAASAAVAQTCTSVAGDISGVVVSGDPVTVLGTVTGDLAGATMAIVSGQAEGENGTLVLTLGHSFVTDANSSLTTSDEAVWTPIPGHDGVFHMHTVYQITGGTGTYAGATGTIENDGIANTTTGLLTLRYYGSVCSN